MISSLKAIFLLLSLLETTLSLSLDTSALTRSRVVEALASPSGKLTISPELVIPEPSDPTAILLQSNAINTLSERIRVSKANAAWVSGGEAALKTFCAEQEQARGNFPGPLPVIASTAGLTPQALAEAGASGTIVSVCEGTELEHLETISSESDWVSKCQQVLECGIQPIPEVTLGDALAQTVDVEELVEQLSTALGHDPVAVLLTMNPADDDQPQVSIPTVPKPLAKKIPILGSIRVTAGENRLGMESQRFKEAGMTGVVLRSDCVPGFRLNPDLDIVGHFWSACIGDLKSTRSKSFQFNSRNNMEKNQAVQWYNYQKDVIDSGALGDPEDNYSIVNDAAGEYKGFA